jgi:osmotically-inducible protein OsmY
MYAPRFIASIALAALVSLTACDKKSDPVAAGPDTTPTAKDKVDVTGDTKTPMDQSESSADIKVTADIRRAILDDKSMSINAQNCKIITEKSGLVTLRGVVNSQAEKESIETKAKAIAGVTKVDNQLEVKPS